MNEIPIMDTERDTEYKEKFNDNIIFDEKTFSIMSFLSC